MATNVEEIQAPSAPTAAELVANARSMVETLRERGFESDERSRLHDETIEQLLNLGILQLMAPSRFGGSEEGLETFFEVGATLGTGDGSTAWLYGILACHHAILSHFPLEVQKEIYGDQSYALFPLTFSGKGGTARRSKGGYTVNGDWSFATGIDFSDWVGGLAMIEGEKDQPLNVLIPKSEVEVIDDWDMAGMRGTGSRRFVARDVFVPEHRTLLQSKLMKGQTPGTDLYPGLFSLRIPFHSMLLVTLVGACFGLAKRAIDEFVALTQSRSGYGGMDHAARSSTQIRIADAMGRYDAHYALVKSHFRELDESARAERKSSAEQRLRYRRDATIAASVCVEIVDSMVTGAGARSQSRKSPFQLIQRDIHTAATHVMLDRDDANELYGKFMLGQDLGNTRM